MGFVSDNFLGGAERRAGEMQANAARRAQDLVQQNTMQALDELRGQYPRAEEALMNAYGDQVGFLRGGQQNALSQLFGYGQQGLDELFGAERQGRQDITNAFSQSMGALSPFAAGGEQAYQQQLALTGALGPERQQQAYDQFVSSPGQEYLQEQGERAVMRNAAASGGMGGQVLQELQRQGQGLAQQDFGNYFNRLAGTSAQGQQAASQLAGLGAQRGSLLSGLTAQMGGSRSNLLSQLGQSGANLTSQFANLLSSAASTRGTGLANLRAQLGTSLSNALIGQGTQLAGLEQDYGAAQASGLLGQTAQRRAFEEQQYGRSMDQAELAMSMMGMLGTGSEITTKQNISELSGEEAFKMVMDLPIKKWQYKPETGIDDLTHYGPMLHEAPVSIVDGTKRIIKYHDENMLMAKALQHVMSNKDNFEKLVKELER